MPTHPQTHLHAHTPPKPISMPTHPQTHLHAHTPPQTHHHAHTPPNPSPCPHTPPNPSPCPHTPNPSPCPHTPPNPSSCPHTPNPSPCPHPPKSKVTHVTPLLAESTQQTQDTYRSFQTDSLHSRVFSSRDGRGFRVVSQSGARCVGTQWAELRGITAIMAAAASLGNSGSKPAWKRQIVRQLRARDQLQKTPYTELFQAYDKLMKRSSLLKELTDALEGGQSRRFWAGTSGSSCTRDAATHQRDIEKLQSYNGELACDACYLRKNVQELDGRLAEQGFRMTALQEATATLCAQRDALQEKVQLSQDANTKLKGEYDQLLCCQDEAGKDLREKELKTEEITDQMTRKKVMEAEEQNRSNESRQSDIWRHHCKKALRKTFSDSNTEAPELGKLRPSSSLENIRNTRERSQSVPSVPSRVVGVFRRLFDFSSRKELEVSEERWCQPSPICVACGVPSRALSSKEVHDSEVHAVKFSPNPRVVATGGSDRVVKLWEVDGGSLYEQFALEGSCSGITNIEFDSSGSCLLAATFDGAAHLWKLSNRTCESLTGHSKKVTAVRFMMGYNRAVTGSIDRTVKEWDLQKAQCIRSLSAPSYCSDVVCCNSCIISGHWDKKIRFWDSRCKSCITEVMLEDKVTSLSLSPDQAELLSCSRDDVLSLIDLRTGNIRKELRDDGFKCGCDWTKALMSPDGRYAIAGSASGAIYIWNVLTGKTESSLNGQHRSSVNALTWSMSGEYVVSVDRGRKAVLWGQY
uniref:Autophagy-related protein 16 domain-containing protein n=1 Tax=Leptobrachium leishanense TaxID=445787 RepID=A0A8C5MCT6_9ANUR